MSASLDLLPVSSSEKDSMMDVLLSTNFSTLKPCKFCETLFTPPTKRTIYCGRKCAYKALKEKSFWRYYEQKKLPLGQRKQKSSEELEPLTREEKEVMWDSVMRIFFPLDAQVADVFLQSSNLGCRGHGIGIVSL